MESVRPDPLQETLVDLYYHYHDIMEAPGCEDLSPRTGVAKVGSTLVHGSVYRLRVPDCKELAATTIQQRFFCPVCNQLMWDAVIAKCGHEFCSGCLRARLKQVAPKCPICKLSIDVQDKSGPRLPSHATRQNIEKIKMRCPYGLSMDVARGAFVSLQDPHAAKQRRLMDEFCPEVMEFPRLLDHISKCEYRLVSCTYANDGCRATVRWRSLSDHERSCQRNPRKCQQCGCRIAKDVTDEVHESEHCEAVCIKCPFADFGCDFQELRKEMDKHLQRCGFRDPRVQHLMRKRMGRSRYTLAGMFSCLRPAVE